MKSMYRILMHACYWVGFLAVILGFVVRHFPNIYFFRNMGHTEHLLSPAFFFSAHWRALQCCGWNPSERIGA